YFKTSLIRNKIHLPDKAQISDPQVLRLELGDGNENIEGKVAFGQQLPDLVEGFAEQQVVGRVQLLADGDYRFVRILFEVVGVELDLLQRQFHALFVVALRRVEPLNVLENDRGYFPFGNQIPGILFLRPVSSLDFQLFDRT